MGIDRLGVLATYAGALRARASLRSRADIERRQARLWRAFTPVIDRTPALSDRTGKPLGAMPVVLPKDIREQFDRWNTLGLTREAALAAAADAERGGPGEVAPGVTAGFSTGTSGSRGVFIASRAERAEYLGRTLAKLLPWDALLRPRRIILCLRADSALYRDVGNAGPFRFRFAPLDTPPRDLQSALQQFRPHVFIAPSHVLAALARLDGTLPKLDRLFYGAEPMGEAERAWIADRFGVRPDPIYQATEGFLGAACTHGTLHLNEDTFVIERTPVPGTNRFRPIVTDLRRTTQPMVRVQLDDLLEPTGDPCACGSPLLAVRGVEGRAPDLWRWADVVIPPRDVETAITSAIGPGMEWRATASPAGVEIMAEGEAGPQALAAIARLLEQRGVTRPVTSVPMISMTDFKRRRVRWRDA